MKRGLAFICVLAAVVLLPPQAADAQEITGTITGLVIDSTGAVIPGVTVIVRNVETNFTLRPVSDATGMYVAPLLPVGTYEVTAERAGFKSFGRVTSAAEPRLIQLGFRLSF